MRRALGKSLAQMCNKTQINIIMRNMSTVTSIKSININMTLTIIMGDIDITNIVTIIVIASTTVATYIRIRSAIVAIVTITIAIIDITTKIVLIIVTTTRHNQRPPDHDKHKRHTKHQLNPGRDPC